MSHGKLVPQLAFRFARVVSHWAWLMPVFAVAAALLKPSIERSNTNPSFIASTALSPSISSLHCAADPAGVSYAPMSVAVPWVRAAPRWSVKTAAVLLPVSMAGLPGSRRMVLVKPPLLARASSLASTLQRLPLVPHCGDAELPEPSITELLTVSFDGSEIYTESLVEPVGMSNPRIVLSTITEPLNGPSAVPVHEPKPRAV